MNANATSTRKRGLVIIGAGATAEIAYEFFTYDSDYEVKAFAVERQFIDKPDLFGVPVVPLEELGSRFSPSDTEIFVAVVYTQLNRVRTRLLEFAKGKGFRPASYVSSRAIVWRNVKLGEHVFIMEANNIQPFVTIGSNTVLWSGNHIGHHSVVEENCFISSHVVVSGFCRVGKNSFLGVNSSLGDHVTLGPDNWIGPGVALTKDTGAGEIYKVDAPSPARVSSLRFFKVPQ